MRTLSILFALLTLTNTALADQFTPSTLDPKLAEAREKAFTPWGDEEQTGNTWRRLSPTHIPVYGEHQLNGLKRGIYIPNPGTAYFSLDGLTEATLWATEREKLKGGDEMVSSASYEDAKGKTLYWALWVPKNKAYLVKDRMHELGIRPAQVDLDRAEPFSGAIAFHRADGHIFYDLKVKEGKVSGVQRVKGASKPIAQVVGGWFELRTGYLSVLIQGGNAIDQKWRVQSQQFYVNRSSKSVALECMLYGDGLTLENSELPTDHVLDALDKVEHLVK